MPREDFFKPNLSLRFFLGTGQFDEDESGNPIERTEDLIVFAKVIQTQNPRYYQMPGITLTDIILEGNIVSPVNDCQTVWRASHLPSQISLETPSEGLLQLFDREYRGAFRFIPRLQPIFKSLQSSFGENIQGYLKVSSRN